MNVNGLAGKPVMESAFPGSGVASPMLKGAEISLFVIPTGVRYYRVTSGVLHQTNRDIAKLDVNSFIKSKRGIASM